MKVELHHGQTSSSIQGHFATKYQTSLFWIVWTLFANAKAKYRTNQATMATSVQVNPGVVRVNVNANKLSSGLNKQVNPRAQCILGKNNNNNEIKKIKNQTVCYSRKTTTQRQMFGGQTRAPRRCEFSIQTIDCLESPISLPRLTAGGSCSVWKRCLQTQAEHTQESAYVRCTTLH